MNRKFWRDAGERAAATFLQAALAAAPVNLTIADWSTARTALITMALAGGAAVLSLVKSMLATRVGDRSSASFLS